MARKKKMALFLLCTTAAVVCAILPGKAFAYNLALGKLVDVSGFISGFGGAKANDGNYSSYWNAPDFGYSSEPNWLTVDLGNLFNVYRIKLVSGYNGPPPGNTGYGFRNIFKIYTSPDNINWTYQYSGEIADSYSGRIDERYFSPVMNVRYVKYEEIGGDYKDIPPWNIHWSNLAEIEVYDPAIAPEPATISLLGLGLLGLFRFRKIRLATKGKER